MLSAVRWLRGVVPLAIAGCGGIAVSDPAMSGASGASAVDSGADASDTVRATVVVRDGAGRSISGADVLISAPDGAVFDTAQTSSDGSVSVVVPVKGSVSLLIRSSGSPTSVPTVSRSISTATGIVDGQTVLFLLSALDDSASSTGSMTLNLSAAGPAGTASYYFSVPCWSARGQSEPTLRITAFAGCSGKSTFDAYAFALDGVGSVLAYGSILDQPFLAGGTRDLAIAVSSTDIVRQSVEVDATDPTAALTVFMLGYRAGDFEHGATLGLRFQTRIDPSGSAPRVELPWPAGMFSDYKFGVRLERGRDGMRRVVSFDRFESAPPSAWNVDPSSLAALDTLDLDHSVVDQPVVTWKLGGIGALGDAVKISTDWSGTEESTSWAIAAPAARSGAVRLPAFPAQWQDFAPTNTVTYGVLSARHFDDMARAGYGDYLATRVIDEASNVDSSTVTR
jgi:hypothetical protein